VSAFVTFQYIANPNSRLTDPIPAHSIMRSCTSTAPFPFYPIAHFSGETHEFTAESNKHKHLQEFEARVWRFFLVNKF
jgi:hypothetical protein